jgi:hypothetical protein
MDAGCDDITKQRLSRSDQAAAGFPSVPISGMHNRKCNHHNRSDPTERPTVLLLVLAKCNFLIRLTYRILLTDKRIICESTAAFGYDSRMAEAVDGSTPFPTTGCSGELNGSVVSVTKRAFRATLY